MRSKIAILYCLAVAALMILPTVSAGDMDLNASTDKTDYTIGEDVEIHADWAVTDPNDFDHDECYIRMEILKGPSSQLVDTLEGWYDVPEQERTGEIPIWCGGKDGFADYSWGTTGQQADDYIVHVFVTSWDNSQSPPNNQIDKDDYTNWFTLS